MLEAHIALPDLSALETILIDFRNSRPHDGNGNPLGIRENLIEFVNEVYSKKASADNSLETKFSHNTKSDVGATLAAHLNTICDSFNNFAGVYPPGQYGVGWGLHFNDKFPIPGIAVRHGAFIPDLNFIRSKEGIHVDKVY